MIVELISQLELNQQTMVQEKFVEKLRMSNIDIIAIIKSLDLRYYRVT